MLSSPGFRNERVEIQEPAKEPIETFKRIYGVPSQKGLEKFDEEDFKERERRSELNAQQIRNAKKTLHRHERSSSRASERSHSAKRELQHMQTEIEEAGQTKSMFFDAVDAIDAAA